MRIRTLLATIAVAAAATTLAACSQSPDPTPPAGATAVQNNIGKQTKEFKQTATNVTGNIDDATFAIFEKASKADAPIDGSAGIKIEGTVSNLGGRAMYLVDIANQAFYGTDPTPRTVDGPFSIESIPVGSPDVHAARKMSFALIVADPGTPAAAEFARLTALPPGSDTFLNRKLVENGGTTVWSGSLYYVWP